MKRLRLWLQAWQLAEPNAWHLRHLQAYRMQPHSITGKYPYDDLIMKDDASA